MFYHGNYVTFFPLSCEVVKLKANPHSANERCDWSDFLSFVFEGPDNRSLSRESVWPETNSHYCIRASEGLLDDVSRDHDQICLQRLVWVIEITGQIWFLIISMAQMRKLRRQRTHQMNIFVCVQIFHCESTEKRLIEKTWAAPGACTCVYVRSVWCSPRPSVFSLLSFMLMASDAPSGICKRQVRGH